jgi:NitT/TauT family transport system ATP-binding protein
MSTAAIHLSNIGFKFENKTIFEDFNHCFTHNSITPLIGKSGSGKSTLIRISSGLLKPTAGNVIYEAFVEPKATGTEQTGDGVQKARIEIKAPSREIMVMNQTYTSFPWMNCLRNVLAHHMFQKDRPTWQNEQEALEILDRVGLHEYARKMPSDLSGGMRQRLALARVLYVKAPVVMMDEPLSALDKSTRIEMQKLLLDHQERTRCTMVIITHDNHEAEILKRNSEILNLTPGG